MNRLTPILAFLILIYTGTYLSAQDKKKIDSLENELRIAKTPKEQCSIQLLLSHEFLTSNPEKGLYYALKAYQIADEKLGDKEKLDIDLALTWIYYTKTDYIKALNTALAAKDLAEKLRQEREQALAMDAIGSVYNDLGDMDKSSEYFFNVIKIYEKLNDQTGMAQALSRIGVLYSSLKNNTKALEYLLRSLEITRKQDNKTGISSNLNSIANVYSDMKDYRKALSYYTESNKIAEEIGDLRLQGAISFHIGIAYMNLNESALSLEYLQNALVIFHTLNNQLRLARTQNQLAEYYLQSGDLKPGIKYADSALHIGVDHGFRDVAYNASELLHRIYLSIKDTSKAYHYAILEGQWKDSLVNGEKQKTLSKLEAQYQFEKEEAARSIKQQRRDYVIIILIIILLSVIIILFLVWTRQKVKAKNVHLQNQTLEQELEFKKKELVLHVMNMIKKNQILSDLSEKLVQIETESRSAESKDTLRKIARELKKTDDEDVWKELSLRFKEVHGEFYERLYQKFPSLTPNELRLCAFLRLNMSSKEIAGLTGQQISSLETARHRLRQKLGISNSEVNLITFLSQL